MKGFFCKKLERNRYKVVSHSALINYIIISFFIYLLIRLNSLKWWFWIICRWKMYLKLLVWNVYRKSYISIGFRLKLLPSLILICGPNDRTPQWFRRPKWGEVDGGWTWWGLYFTRPNGQRVQQLVFSLKSWGKINPLRPLHLIGSDRNSSIPFWSSYQTIATQVSRVYLTTRQTLLS